MGSQQDSIREKLVSKSALITWLITPAIVGGIALLGFQTYRLIAGDSFADFDFGIGKLWSTEEPFKMPDFTDNTTSSFVRIIQRELDILPEESKLLPQKISIPSRKKSAPLVKNNSSLSVITSEKVGKLFSSEIIFANSITANFGNKQLIKYVDRLQNDFLVNPGLVPQKGNWYIGLSFAPSVCYRSFGYTGLVPGIATDGETQYTFGLTEEDRNNTDKAITSYAVGLDFGKRVSDKLSIFSGLHYAKYGEQIRVQVADKDNPNYDMSSFMNKQPQYERVGSKEGATLPYSNRYSFLEVPIGLSYTLKDNTKSNISLNTALILQRLDHVNALVYDFDTDYYYWMNSKEELFREYGIGASIGVSFSKYVGERLEVYVSPQFKYNLNSTFQTPYPIAQNQYTTGLQVGFKQQLF